MKTLPAGLPKMSRHGSGGETARVARFARARASGIALAMRPPYMRVINQSLSERGGNAASVHVVQVLVLLAVEDVVVDDLEASEARARRDPPMNARSLQRIRGAVPTWPSRPWLASA